MEKLLILDDHKPRIVLPLIDDNSLVVPVRYIEDLIHKRQKLKITDDNEIMILSIINEWYEHITNTPSI